MIGLIKTNDLREKYLSQMYSDIIYSNIESDFINVDKLYLLNNGIDNNLYIKNTSINLENLIRTNDLKEVVVFRSNEILKHILNKYNIKLIELFDNPLFVAQNAMLTAEGLIRVISNDILYSLKDCKILVLGYGYVGMSIVSYLNNYTSCSVYSVNETEIKNIIISGNNIVSNISSDYDIIINTIPVNIFDIDLINDDTLVYDVSSYPYGFKTCRKVKIVPAIPGNLLPKSAAYIIKKALN